MGSLVLIVQVERLPGSLGDFFYCREQHVGMLFDLKIIQLIPYNNYKAINERGVRIYIILVKLIKCYNIKEKYIFLLCEEELHIDIHSN